MKEMCETQEETMLKQKPHFVKFKENILVSQWTFHPTFVYIYIYIYIHSHDAMGKLPF